MYLVVSGCFGFPFLFLTLRVRTKAHLEGVQSGRLEVTSASSGIPSETSMVSEMPLLGVLNEEDPEPVQDYYNDFFGSSRSTCLGSLLSIIEVGFRCSFALVESLRIPVV